MGNCHESEELNNRLGKSVKITFFDGAEETGVLRRHIFGSKYIINDLVFCKSHVKRITDLNQGLFSFTESTNDSTSKRGSRYMKSNYKH